MRPPFRSLDDQAKALAQLEKSRIQAFARAQSAGSNFLVRKRLASEGKRKLTSVHRSLLGGDAPQCGEGLFRSIHIDSDWLHGRFEQSGPRSHYFVRNKKRSSSPSFPIFEGGIYEKRKVDASGDFDAGVGPHVCTIARKLERRGPSALRV